MTSPPPQYLIDITLRQTTSLVAEDALRQAVETTLSEEQISSAEVSLVLTDDAEIHRINRDFLDHDYPTDVISFRLNDEPPAANGGPACSSHLDGELIISQETAARAAADEGWSLESELVLYVVHGLLHLCGYDDLADPARPIMRRREREILTKLNRFPAGKSAGHSQADRSE